MFEVFIKHYFIIFIAFCFLKALENAMLHDYPAWKKRFGIPNKWDWWFNPKESWKNKYKGWLWKILTPISDCWHTIWTVSMSSYIIYIMIEINLYQGLMVGVIGIFVIFNFFYPFFRRKEIL